MGTVQKIGPFDVEINSIDDATREFFEGQGALQRCISPPSPPARAACL